MNLHYEVQQEKEQQQRFNRRLQYLSETYKLAGGKDKSYIFEKLCRRVSHRNELSDAYSKLCKQLNQSYSKETLPTVSEKNFLKHFNSSYKVHLYPQTWIGNLSTDFFTPALGLYKANFSRGYVLKGLAFEIDGGVHNLETKMKKDEYKTKALHSLGITVIRVTNEQAHNIHSFVFSPAMFEQYGRLCSRARKRIWMRIHLMTILYHASFGMVSYYFPKMKTARDGGL